MQNVLVIDDDDIIREMVSIYLTRLGYRVMVARNGEEGIKLLGNGEEFHIVVTDIRMPKKSGNEVAGFIRNSLKLEHLPVVAMTGFARDVEKKLFDCLLEKPFKMKDLADVLGSFQGSRSRE